MTNFTPEDLLMYLYKEASTEQNQAIEEALKKDWTLREKLNVLCYHPSRSHHRTTNQRRQTKEGDF